MTGLRCDAVAAQLTTFVRGRQLDDDAQLMLRFSNGARGLLWASQSLWATRTACGCACTARAAHWNGFRNIPINCGLPCSGSRHASFRVVVLVVGRQPHGRRACPAAPGRLIEAFAQLYRDFAALIEIADGAPGTDAEHPLPTAQHGLRPCFSSKRRSHRVAQKPPGPQSARIAIDCRAARCSHLYVVGLLGSASIL